MTMRRLTYAAVSISILCSCTVKHEVYRVEGATNIDDKKGIYYTLPQSQIVSTFAITRKHRAQSLFCRDLAQAILEKDNKGKKSLTTEFISQETKRLSGDDNWNCSQVAIDKFAEIENQKSNVNQFFNNLAALAINIRTGEKPENNPRYSLKLNSVATEPEPDPGQLFLVRADGERFEDRNIEIALSEIGFITSAKSAATDKGTQMTVDTINALAGIVSTVFFGQGKVATLAEGEDGGNGINIEEADPITRLFIKALAKIVRLSEIRSTKKQLLSESTTNIKIDVLNKKLNDLAQEESAIIDYFHGKESVKMLTYPVRYLAESDTSDLLFEFISSCGVHEPHSNSAYFVTPPKDFLCPSDHNGEKKKVNISVIKAKHAKTISDSITNHEAKDKSKARGFYYRVPAQARITLTHGENRLQDVFLPIPQLGAVASFPSDMNSSDILLQLEYNESLGSLNKVVATNKAPTVNPAADVLGAAQGVLTAREAEKSAREAEKDELAVLEREVSILEKRKQKLELEKEIDALTPKGDLESEDQ